MNPSLLFILLCLPALAAQHLAHEYAHVAAAKLCGVKVLGIRWLAYGGGTRVLFENEPDFGGSPNPNAGKWAWIGISGYLVTNVVGYLLALTFFLLSAGPAKAAVCVFGIVFLFCDSLYFLLGSIFGFGDVVGFGNAMRLSKRQSVLGSLLVFGVNLLLIIALFR